MTDLVTLATATALNAYGDRTDRVFDAYDGKGHIEPGERYREGEMDPYYAGGFGKERVCLGYDKAGLA